MTEERIKKMLRSRIRGESLGIFIAFIILGLLMSLIGGSTCFAICLMVGIVFSVKTSIENHDDIKNIDNSLLFIIYPDMDVLIKVMDEIIDHPIYKANGTNISEHFILYGDQYENIIRLCDVTGINITKLNDVYSRIDIEDRFGQKKKIKIECLKAEEIYNYLSENCKNATIGSPIVFDEESSNIIYIEYDSKLTEEYCFGWDKSKKRKKKETKKEIKQEEVVEEEETEEVEEETPKRESTSMDQKYNDLKNLKELLDSDIITQEDYDKEKAKILSD